MVLPARDNMIPRDFLMLILGITISKLATLMRNSQMTSSTKEQIPFLKFWTGPKAKRNRVKSYSIRKNSDTGFQIIGQ